MLAKLTSKNQLTLPKSVTAALGPVQYFEVQSKAGQIILTPVRIQRGDALRAKLAELAIDATTLEDALSWAEPAKPSRAIKKAPAKPLSAKKAGPKAVAAPRKAPAAGKTVAKKTIAKKAVAKPKAVANASTAKAARTAKR